jgi:hypothetical protein
MVKRWEKLVKHHHFYLESFLQGLDEESLDRPMNHQSRSISIFLLVLIQYILGLFSSILCLVTFVCLLLL